MFGVGEAIAAGSNLISTIVTRIWPDANVEEKARLELALGEMQNEYEVIISQIETNQVEAASSSLFVAGWRPFVGWVCGFALAYAAIVEPLFNAVAMSVFGLTERFPPINTDVTLQVLMGMLGLGGLRTYEKYKGIARRRM